MCWIGPETANAPDMCGIAGRLNFASENYASSQLIRRMTDLIAHRGPDSEGQYLSGPLGLGHRRLSIIDVSAGAQPLCNEDKSIWIVFNGEIYNFLELRAQLLNKGHVFTTASDTEVIVHLYEEYGTECLGLLKGMFAFAIWNDKSKELLLARDRVGIKPLYYSHKADFIAFASEIKSILVNPEIERDINFQGLDLFLSFLYLPGRETLFKDVQKLEPGHYLLVRNGKILKRQYWELTSQPRACANFQREAENLNELLRAKLRAHMISDVPVGFLASGGVDSTALLSYAGEETDKQIKTFTVGFSEQNFADERPYARAASDAFNTEHHEISISANEFINFLPAYIWHMEEPVCEPPAIALYYISKLAREHVKVLLSGEGGDEAFAGYPEYRNFSLLERLKSFGPIGRAVAAPLFRHGNVFGLAKLRRFEPMLNVALQDYYYSRSSTPFEHFNPIKAQLYSPALRQEVNGSHPGNLVHSFFHKAQSANVLQQMLFVDTKTWLPDDLLVKADKMTMATSVELRVPFLDHEVLEFAAGLPQDFKLRGFRTKRILKHCFRNRVPREILKRKKTGFPVPYNKWLRHDAKDFVVETLTSRKARERDLFNKSQVEKLLRTFLETGAGAKLIFSLLVLELWYEKFVDVSVRPDLSGTALCLAH
jgi:asparagine synthase (glutamine-hydrolysing)